MSYQVLGQGVPSGKPHEFAQTGGSSGGPQFVRRCMKPATLNGVPAVRTGNRTSSAAAVVMAAGLKPKLLFRQVVLQTSGRSLSGLMAWRVLTIEARVTGSAHDTVN